MEANLEDKVPLIARKEIKEKRKVGVLICANYFPAMED